MAKAAKTRKAKEPEKLRSVSLSNAGHWHMDANLANRLFGPSKFTEVQQADNPNAQMTRVIKDVVRVGKWKRGIDPRTGKPVLLDITPEMLQSVQANFKLAKSRGVDFNIGKNHANPATDLIHPDDLITPIDDVAIVGDTLWACAYVTPADQVYLSNRARKVSAGLRWDWIDGFGNVYEIQMPHIAVTDNPIVAGQGPFVFLANANPADDIQVDEGATPVDEQLVEILNRFLALTNLGQLPEGITEQNLYIVLNALLGTLDSEDDDETDDPDPSRSGQTLPPLNPAAGANMPAELANTNPPAQGTPAGGTPAAPAAAPAAPQAVNLSNVVVPMPDGTTKPLGDVLALLFAGQTQTTASIANLSNSVDALKGDKVSAAKAAYTAEVERLKATGDITVAVGDQQMKIGEVIGWDLSNLACLKGAKMVDLSNRGKGAASAAAPTVDGVTKPLSEADIAEGVDLLLNRPKKPATAAA